MTNQELSNPGRRSFLDAALAVPLATAGGLGIAGTASAASGPTATDPVDSRQARRRFEGKVIMVTGATSGIGKAAAEAFAAEGGKVAFCGRRADAGAEVERLIRTAGGEALFVRADVREDRDMERFVAETVKRYGRLDVALNNAGISLEKPLHEFTVAEWDDVQNTNVRGVFLAMRHQIPVMLQAGKGNIVVTSSTQALTTGEKKSAYAASKRALLGLVEAAAFDYADKGIRVNALLPGTTDTPMVRRLAGMDSLPDFAWRMGIGQWAKTHVPGLKRVASAQEMAAAALTLASDEHPYLLGTSFVVDGGQSSHAP